MSKRFKESNFTGWMITNGYYYIEDMRGYRVWFKASDWGVLNQTIVSNDDLYDLYDQHQQELRKWKKNHKRRMIIYNLLVLVGVIILTYFLIIKG